MSNDTAPHAVPGYDQAQTGGDDVTGMGDTACQGGSGAAPSVLVVEDNLIVAMEIEDALLACGLAVETADSIRAAEHCIGSGRFSAALVDCLLPDGHAHDIALQLEAHGTRVALVTGTDASALPRALAHMPRFEKPVPAEALARWVAQVLRGT